MPTPDELVRAARVRLSNPNASGSEASKKSMPYLSAALWTLRLVPDDRVPTMGVDAGWNCYYNPEVVKNWPVETIATVLVHEVWHLLKGHHKRAKQAGIIVVNQPAWNVATDREINDGMLEIGMPFPPGITPIGPATDQMVFGKSMPNDLLAEEYYDALPRSNQPPPPQYGGSSADGIKRPWEEGSGGEGQEQDGKAKGQAQGAGQRVIPEELIRKQVADEICKTRGTVPRDWQRWAKKINTPHQIPWQAVFRAVVGRMIVAGRRDDWSYTRPSRRVLLDPSFIMPGMVGTLPDVAVLVDTSGSMGEEELGECLSILESILEHLGRTYPITVVAGDTCPQTTSKVTAAHNVNLQGGGGTDMRALIDHAVTLKPKPQIIVVLTDGYTPWPERAPAGVQTVVVLVNEGESPSWATTIKTK